MIVNSSSPAGDRNRTSSERAWETSANSPPARNAPGVNRATTWLMPCHATLPYRSARPSDSHGLAAHHSKSTVWRLSRNDAGGRFGLNVLAALAGWVSAGLFSRPTEAHVDLNSICLKSDDYYSWLMTIKNH